MTFHIDSIDMIPIYTKTSNDIQIAYIRVRSPRDAVQIPQVMTVCSMLLDKALECDRYVILNSIVDITVIIAQRW
jgi:hypothetical protein